MSHPLWYTYSMIIENNMKNENKTDKPLTAILVSIKQDQKDIKQSVRIAVPKLNKTKAVIQKIQIPSGPALINGQWW